MSISGTRVVKTQKAKIPMTIKDLVRLDPSTVAVERESGRVSVGPKRRARTYTDWCGAVSVSAVPPVRIPTERGTYGQTNYKSAM